MKQFILFCKKCREKSQINIHLFELGVIINCFTCEKEEVLMSQQIKKADYSDHIKNRSKIVNN
jgi:hypothetical protein